MSHRQPVTRTITALVCVLAALCLHARCAHAQTVAYEPGATCLICHGHDAVTYAKSVHGRFDVSCVDCHGGDATQILWSQAMDPQAGFQGQFSKTETLTLCNGCHGDYEKMRQYGLPVDQLAQYKTSEHGKALLLTGSRDAAVCTDCHGAHDILEVDDPEAWVYPTNIPGMCARCHADKKLMQPLGIKSDVVDSFSKGMHGKRLLQGDLAAPTCSVCHGSHGAAPPGVAEVVNVCGQCHTNIRKQFKRSAHYREKLECITCHDSHDNQHPTTDKFTSARPGGCRNCHTEADSEPVAFINSTLDSLKQARTEYAESEQAMKRAGRQGFYVQGEQVLLKEAHTALMEFRNTQHSLSMEDTAGQLATVTSKASHVMENIKAKRERITDRRIVVTIVTAYLLAMLLLLLIKYRRLKRAHLEGRPREDV